MNGKILRMARELADGDDSQADALVRELIRGCMVSGVEVEYRTLRRRERFPWETDATYTQWWNGGAGKARSYSLASAKRLGMGPPHAVAVIDLGEVTE